MENLGDMIRPEYLKDEHLLYLDSLMRGGFITSFKASQLLIHKFPKLTMEEANTIISYWIYTYYDRNEL